MTEVLHVRYGSATIECLVERRERATLELRVDADGTVRAVAPASADLDELRSRIARRGRWILGQQRYFAQFAPRTPPRRYVPGETHLYLGRQHRIRIVSGDLGVRLVRGFIEVSGVEFDDSVSLERLVTRWFRMRAEVLLPARVELNRARFPEPAMLGSPTVRIRVMRGRWGSTSGSGQLILNPDLVRAPIDSIDYVVTHELCHLRVPNHGRAFFDLQRRAMPDWERRKQRLERIMS